MSNVVNRITYINEMTTGSFLQVLTIYLTWTLRTPARLSSQSPVRVGACVQYSGWSTLASWRLTPLPGADDVLQIDSVDVRNTEQRNPGSSMAGKCLWPISCTGPTLAAW